MNRIEQATKFITETQAEDFGVLEDVHDYVVMHCQDNAVDVPDSEVYACLRSTLSMYIDDSDTHEVFETYRK